MSSGHHSYFSAEQQYIYPSVTPHTTGHHQTSMPNFGFARTMTPRESSMPPSTLCAQIQHNHMSPPDYVRTPPPYSSAYFSGSASSPYSSTLASSPCPMSHPLGMADASLGRPFMPESVDGFTDRPAYDTSIPERTPTPTTLLMPERVLNTPRAKISHPYARITAQRERGASKRRRIWNHTLEKQVFTPEELSTMGAPERRSIYIASLEAYIDQLHSDFIGAGLYPVPFESLAPYKGLNTKTAKSMVAALNLDAQHARLKLLELQRANTNLHGMTTG